ncbi:MAG: RtcB family protein [Candidatus Eisenbacteria bacterium]|uniref:tRNA-splicing ligase RtcB n=1 Tax=Eiseniibacteriota bacterium TaxID=2212470 RepID=A0A948RZ08_UNCEI|nr:RtcB family protein [Candidatus Eisenbacteria bacterium]MBU1948340.1 RtcB family protein [Candidatus Eisenbacteria bacterium]MBU2692233.1 RtcB family protein [Candidatus Eisenbacteria bacterium]
MKLERVKDWLWEIPKTGKMRVPGRIYATKPLLEQLRSEGGLEQVANVAHLPGIVGYSLAMPDIHWGYGFPIGGVAATDPAAGGVISPGGVGYDINCGVRLATTQLQLEDVQPKIQKLVASMFRHIPCGVGSHGAVKRAGHQEMLDLIKNGARWAVKRGYGKSDDLNFIEDGGSLPGADPDRVSQRAMDRGSEQVGTLGSGNHFAEIEVVEEIYHPEAAREFGIREGQITLMIHTGSRGFGYQICDDYLKLMGRAIRRYNIEIPDRQLACAPVESEEGRGYLAAMFAAANYAWANRQTIMHLAEKAFLEGLSCHPRDLGLSLVYDVCHNIAKLENHQVGGKTRRLCVHRKGATRAFWPQGTRPGRSVGQPIIIPGDMGSCSYLAVGTPKSLEETFGSTAHGAGRVMSRTQAVKTFAGRDLAAELSEEGITVMAQGRRTLAEEMRGAYKNVADVVDTMELAGISLKVARLRPIGVIKG